MNDEFEALEPSTQIAGNSPPSNRAVVKPIPGARDRMQSKLLTGAVGFLLLAKLPIEICAMHAAGSLNGPFFATCVLSIIFALAVWLLRAATAPAALMGGAVCTNILMRQQHGFDAQHSAIFSLLALFVLTFAATRFGRPQKETLGLAEGRAGRRASQVVANLGVAGLLGSVGIIGTRFSTFALAASIAALAEATADTVSSELGQALASSRFGTTVLITSGRPVPPGTDGGISIAGTVAGILAAAVVVLLSPFAYSLGPAVCIFAASIAGLLFDSLLGATVERRGWLNNDLVNFISTIFAAAVGWATLSLL